MFDHTVSPEGSVHVTPEFINAERNTIVEFICSALGGPANNFTWFGISDGAVVASEPVLQIAVEDAFVGSGYECLVENDAGSDSAAVTLNGMVYIALLRQFTIITASYFICYSVAPLFLVGPSDVNATLSENFTLVCSASGYPVPAIIWTYNGTIVNEEENDRATIISELVASRSVISTLTVSMAMINDSGDYACIATSSDFQPVVAGPVTVLVQGKTRIKEFRCYETKIEKKAAQARKLKYILVHTTATYSEHTLCPLSASYSS